MKSVSVIFPHQLFLENPPAGTGQRVYLVEEDLFFRQYPFHKSKLVFHRASMKYYQDYLEKGGAEVRFVESGEEMKSYLDAHPSPLQTSFYIAQRRKHGFLLESGGRPAGGKWTFDAKNRKKYPADLVPSRISWPGVSEFLREAAG